MSTSNLTLDEMTATGAHRTGHFRLSSGLHSGDYLQCALYLADPVRAERAGGLIADGVRSLGVDPELVVSPALGGVIIGHEVARALGTPFLFTERQDGVMTLRRGFAIAPGQKVVVVEDVVTTGKSTREVVRVLEEAGATVLAMASMVNRSGTPNPFEPLPYHALLTVDFPVWKPEECPLCERGLPIEKPGSRPVA
ncbi:MAG TPA: orotate phosphoribosyltransferase [Polyangiaceae bacterium]|nr:orotate phosphoribosyltransferase [Polyangiaceae bacterium]